MPTEINPNKDPHQPRSLSSPPALLLLAVLTLRGVLDIEESGEAEHLQLWCSTRALRLQEISQEKRRLVVQKEGGNISDRLRSKDNDKG